MTTDVEALIEELQKELYGPASWSDTVLMSRSIDALRSQAERIQALESSNGHLRDALRAQSDKIQSMALQSISDEANRERLQAKIDEQAKSIQALEAALREIAKQDHVELMLDPTWAQRVAKAALNKKEQS